MTRWRITRWRNHVPGHAIVAEGRDTGVCTCFEQRVLGHDDAHPRRGVELAHPPHDGHDVAGVHVSTPLPLLLGAVGPPALELGRPRQ